MTLKMYLLTNDIKRVSDLAEFEGVTNRTLNNWYRINIKLIDAAIRRYKERGNENNLER